MWYYNLPHACLLPIVLNMKLACFQISRMLVVDPKQRYTATDALNHPFFSQYVVAEVRQFSPYRRFKVRRVEHCTTTMNRFDIQ